MTATMSESTADRISVEGRCLCGSVSYRVAGRQNGLVQCHCRRCRKHHGSSFASFVVFEDAELAWHGGRDLLETFASSAKVHRAFCRICGSVMPHPTAASGQWLSLAAGNILDMPQPGRIYHVYTASKASWSLVSEGAEQYSALPPGWRNPHLPGLARPVEDGRLCGSCLCGDVTFTAAQPLFMLNCHCTRCRLSRSAAHATNLFVPGNRFEWKSGEEQVTTYKLPDAERFGAAFCQRCGSLVPRVQSPNMERINIPAGSLDTDPAMTPRGHIYVGSKARWFRIEDELPAWETLPPASGS